jgi:hypothetical protein
MSVVVARGERGACIDACRYLCVVNMGIGVSWMVASPMTYGAALTVADQFVASFTVKMQENIGDIMDLEHLVIDKFVKVSGIPKMPRALRALPCLCCSMMRCLCDV